MILGKVDAVVFTAGIGENSKWVVKKSTEGLKQMLNNPPQVLVIPTNEELMIANLAYKTLKSQSNSALFK